MCGHSLITPLGHVVEVAIVGLVAVRIGTGFSIGFSIGLSIGFSIGFNIISLLGRFCSDESCGSDKGNGNGWRAVLPGCP